MRKYHGAGLAIVIQDEKNRPLVLLGRRRHRPGRYQWSFPGGRLEGRETSSEGALREAEEELTLWPGAPSWPDSDKLTALWSSRLYDWTTWLWKTQNPKLLLPQNGRDREFDAWGWFPLDALPRPLHYGVKATLRNLGGS